MGRNGTLPPNPTSIHPLSRLRGILDYFYKLVQANAAEESVTLILNLKALWEKANLSERRILFLSMFNAVFFEMKETKSIVAVRPKPPIKPIFQVAASKVGSGIRIINEPYLSSAVFLVEAGESRTPRPKEATQNILQA